MAALLFAGLSAGVGLGVLLVIQGLRGRPILPASMLDLRAAASGERLVWIAGGLTASALVLVITGWPVAAAAALILVIAGPRLLGGQQDREGAIARTQAVATWTEMIRDNMAGAAGLEQALIATAALAPAPIATEVRRFASRLDDMALSEALAMLGDDLNHPSADFVVAALANTVRMESRDLGSLLSRLAESIRGDVRMRLRVEVGRARIRMSSRIVMAVTVFVVGFLFVFSRPLLSVYDSPVGQLWLLLILGVFAFGLWTMNHYSQMEMPERFTARHAGDRRAVGGER